MKFFYLHSTVVLLKLECCLGNTNPVSYLHSTVVLLELEYTLQSVDIIENLHSTVVLLKRCFFDCLTNGVQIYILL